MSTINKHPDWFTVVLVALVTLFVVLVYTYLFILIIGGSLAVALTPSTVPDALIAAFAFTLAIITWKWARRGTSRGMLLAGSLLQGSIMIAVISINKYIAVFPTSDADQWMIVPYVFTLFATPFVAYGFIRLIRETYYL